MFSGDAAFSILFWLRMWANLFIGAEYFKEPWLIKEPSEHWYRGGGTADTIDRFQIVSWNNFTEQHLINSFVHKTHAIVFKNFTKGALDFMKDPNYFLNDVENLNYAFYNKTTYGGTFDADLHDGVRRILGGETILFRGNTAFLNPENPFFDNVLGCFKTMYESFPFAEKYFTVFDAQKTNTFLYQGNWYRTPFHNSFADDSLIQVSNTKIWTFVHHKYTAAMNPIHMFPGTLVAQTCCASSPSLQHLKEKGMPYTQIWTEPGDFLYFPTYWWHEVENRYPDQFGLAFAFRTMRGPHYVRSFIFPPIEPERAVLNAQSMFRFAKLFFGSKTAVSMLANGEGMNPENILKRDDFIKTNRAYLNPYCMDQCEMEFRNHPPKY